MHDSSRVSRLCCFDVFSLCSLSYAKLLRRGPPSYGRDSVNIDNYPVLEKPTVRDDMRKGTESSGNLPAGLSSESRTLFQALTGDGPPLSIGTREEALIKAHRVEMERKEEMLAEVNQAIAPETEPVPDTDPDTDPDANTK